MAKSKSWSVKGIDDETRDIARDAAQAAGMTIGAWIDQAILKAKRGDLGGVAMPAFDVVIVNTTVNESVTELPVAATAPAERVAPQDPQPTTQTRAPTVELTTATAPEPEPASRSVPDVPVASESGLSNSPFQPDTSSDGGTGSDGGVGWSPDAGYAGPKPLPSSQPRASARRYIVLAAVFLAILGGGGWLFVELSSTEKLRAPQTATAPRANLPGGKTKTAPTTTTVSPDSATPALADEIRTGIELARAGNSKAQHDLGMLHLSGRYVKKDSAEAASWFERAAIQGLASAQFNLGVLYQRGEGVAQNDRLAFFWYQSAAEQGMVRAQHNLATAYAEGKGVPKSYDKAAEWFTKAANAGLGASQYSLAMIYERGLVTGTPDLARARTWYEKAMAQGDTQATERLAVIERQLALGKPPQTGTARPASKAPVVSSAPETPAQVTAIGRSEIREIQTLLAQMNFNPGPADGQMGRRTADAIRLYQQFSGIEIDGTPTMELLEDMRAVAGSMSKGG